jgi:hypothetical protein
MINNENEKNHSSNELNENESSINEEEKNEENELGEEPIYVMTVELEKGKSESIKIYSNSKPEELAFSFCKKYNLDFSSLSYLSTQIKSLIENLPNGNDSPEKNNEPIEEVDEENNPPSSEAPSKKIGSQSNSTNLSPGALNNKRKIIDNNFDNNINNNHDFNTFNNNNYEKEIQKLKGLNPNNVNNYSNKPLSSLFNGFEYRSYLMERFNHKNDKNRKKNNKQNIHTYKNKINYNSGKKYNSNKNINYNNLNESSDDININVESKNNLSGNIDFYKKRNKIFSYDKFFSELKKSFINKNKEKESSTLFDNTTNNILKQDSYYNNFNNNLYIENSIPVKSKNKKNNNKASYFFDSDLTLTKNKIKFDMFLNNCNLLDEIYQNKIDDTGVFLSKNLQNYNIEEPRRNLNLKEYNNYKLADNKRYVDKDLSKLKGNCSFKKGTSNKIKDEKYYRNINNNFSSSLTNSPNQKIYKKKNKSLSKIKNSSRNKINLEKKINPFKKSYKEYFHSTNKDNKTLTYSIFNSHTNVEDLTDREILFNQNKDKSFKKLFNLLDSDKDGSINILSMETKGIPITIFNIISPIIQNIKNKNDDIKENDFVILGRKLFNNLSFHERRALFNFTNSI